MHIILTLVAKIGKYSVEWNLLKESFNRQELKQFRHEVKSSRLLLQNLAMIEVMRLNAKAKVVLFYSFGFVITLVFN